VVRELIGSYAEVIRLLGQRTVELHLALASNLADPDFAPEPFSVLYQRSRYQYLRILSTRAFHLLRQCLQRLPEAVRAEAQGILSLEDEVGRRLRSVFTRKITALRIRCHGNYHLGQILYTGNNVVILDFEGEPLRSLSERRLKHSPLRDVASMLRSFHYAAYTALFNRTARGGRHADRHASATLEPWAIWWWQAVSTIFLDAYLAAAGQAAFLPRTREERQVLLNIFLLEKAFYELGYELNNRLDWVRIPLQGIRQLMGAVKRRSGSKEISGTDRVRVSSVCRVPEEQVEPRERERAPANHGTRRHRTPQDIRASEFPNRQQTGHDRHEDA